MSPTFRAHYNIRRIKPRSLKGSSGWLDIQRAVSTYGYTQSKALVYPADGHGEPAEVLKLHSYSIPPAYSTNLTLRFLASPINPSDVNQIQGKYPSRPLSHPELGSKPSCIVGGNEGVAEVIAIGSGVKTLRRGDWVIPRAPNFGTWRTYASAPTEDLLFKLDDKTGISPIQAATVSVNPCTAYRMLRDFVALDRQRGDWFIQNGANSSVGRAAIQLGKLWGYKSINVVRNREGFRELEKELKDLGADVVVTDEELQNHAELKSKVEQWTSGGKEHVRLALDCVGGKSTTALAKLLSPDGHVVTYGAMSRMATLLPPGLVIFKNITFHGFWISRWGQQHPEEKKAMVEEMLSLIKEGKFRIDAVREIEWQDDTKEEVLKTEVQSTLEGFKGGKGVFVFKE